MFAFGAPQGPPLTRGTNTDRANLNTGVVPNEGQIKAALSIVTGSAVLASFKVKGYVYEVKVRSIWWDLVESREIGGSDSAPVFRRWVAKATWTKGHVLNGRYRIATPFRLLLR
jgi:hypothetical protein